MPEHAIPDFWVKGGLLDAKHLHAMGKARWLYDYLQCRVRFSGEGAGTTPPEAPYQHGDAATALGIPRRTVERWFHQLAAAGYLTARRRRLGLDVTITKYQDVRQRAAVRYAKSGVSNKEAPPPPAAPAPAPADEPRYAKSGASQQSRYAKSGGEIRQKWRDDPPKVADHSNRTRATRDSRETRDSPPIVPQPPDAVPPRPRTELQRCVDAYLEATQRDPQKVGNYKRYVAAGKECAASGYGAADVAACTQWLASDPFYAGRGLPPPFERVVERLPGWIKLGRPREYREPARNGGGPEPIRSVAQLAAQRLKQMQEHGYDDEHFTNRGDGSSGSNNGLAAELPGIPARHGPAHQQLPPPRGG